MTQESQQSLPIYIQEKELIDSRLGENLLPLNEEKQLPGQSEDLLSPSQQLMGVIERLKKTAYDKDLKEKSPEHSSKRLTVNEKVQDFENFVEIVFSDGIIEGKTYEESKIYKNELKRKLWDRLNKDNDGSLSEKDMSIEIAEISRNKISSVLDGEGDLATNKIEKFVNDFYSEGLINIKSEAEQIFTNDNSLAIFTTNPQNLETMKDIISSQGKDFFLSCVSDNITQKILEKFPVENHEKIKRIISDKINFNYDHYQLHQFISKNSEIAHLINKAKYYEEYVNNKENMKVQIDELNTDLAKQNIDLDSPIMFINNPKGVSGPELCINQIQANIEDVDKIIENNQKQIEYFEKESLGKTTPVIENLKQSKLEAYRKKMELNAIHFNIRRKVEKLQSIIKGVGFELESDKMDKMTMGDLIKKIENFTNKDKFTSGEMLLAKQYEEIRFPMDHIARHYFMNNHYSYWTGDKNGEDAVSNWRFWK